MSTKTRRIQIAALDGPFEVKATVIGCFAYHPSIVRVDGETTLSPVYLTVTHLPTGYAVTTAARSTGRAAALIRELLKATPQWYELQLDFSSPVWENIKAATQPVLGRYRLMGWA